MSKDFKPRAKPVGTVKCHQVVQVNPYKTGMVERPAFTEGEDLVVAQPAEGGLLAIIHVPSGMSATGGLYFRSVKAAAAAIEELRIHADWRLPEAELMKVAMAKGLGGVVRDVCSRHGAE